MKRAILIVLPLLVILGGVYWFATHAYLSITIDSSQPGESNVSLLNQSTGQTINISTSSGQVKKLLPRGSYEVLAGQSANHAFALTDVGGFLSTNELRLRVEPESLRSFIGNEALPCMGLSGTVLFSSACGDTVTNVQLHMPSTASQPTYTKKLPTPIRGFLEGSVQTTEGSIVIIKAPANSEEEGPPHGAYTIGTDGLGLVSALDDLDDSTYYSVAPYKTGFIAYNLAAGDLIYYANAKTDPETLTAPVITSDLLFYSLGSFGDKLVLTYSSEAGEEPADIDQARGLEVHSEVAEKRSERDPESQVVVMSGQNQKVYEFGFAPQKVRLCALDALCVLKEDGELLVYDVRSDKPDLMYSLKNVLSIHTFGETFLVVRQDEIVKLEATNKRGEVIYSLGDYSYCGLQPAGAQLLLCVANSKNKRSVLALSPGEANIDSIDKKVAELLKIKAVKDVSPYGKLVFVSPELGELELQESTGDFAYDAEKVRQTASEIDAAVGRIGFDGYSVINPYR